MSVEKVNGYDIGREELEAPDPRDVLPVNIFPTPTQSSADRGLSILDTAFGSSVVVIMGMSASSFFFFFEFVYIIINEFEKEKKKDS